MPTKLKRKGSPTLEDTEDVGSKRRFAETTDHAASAEAEAEAEAEPAPSPASEPSGSDRAARFAALRTRSAAGRKSNLAATKYEAGRASSSSPAAAAALATLARKRTEAEHNLLKADAAARGEDFERKRAWDYTVDEAAAWEERMAERRARAEANGFRDYGQEASKVYDRQIGSLGKNAETWAARREEYEAERRAAIEAAVAGGGLEIVELEGGELVAVDRDGSFISSASAMGSGGPESGGAQQRPSKAAVDRLVADIRKAEDERLRKRRERARAGADNDGADVTFINQKNKQFNLKLARFYDKYTADIRDSFERGTAM